MAGPWDMTEAKRRQLREAQIAAKRRERWRCADCGWPWPLPGDPPDGAECDNCGGELSDD